jgi:hypothetical protein
MKKFIVSVGEVILRNIATKEIIAIGTTAVDTSFTLTATKTDVRGGVGNSILFSYVSERSFDVSITQASFNKEVLALNAGSLIQTGSIEYLYTECLELSALGGATLSKVPTGNVTIILPTDIKTSVIPSGSDILVPDGENLTVHATYMTSGTAESVLIGSNTPPSMVELFYTTEVRDDTNVVVELMQIYVPKFQLSGNYTMTFNANGVANEAIEGSAMLSSEGGCGMSGVYARIAWLPVSGVASSSFSLIAATPSDWDFSVAQGLPQSKQIEVLGIPGDGIRANINITSGCTFAKEAGGDADITISAGGLVTCANTATAGDSAIIVVTHTDSGTTDRCIFNVVA